ncbi:MAG: restriction endonuclease subunit S [Chloroflexi bacterium]|nr:restriction endonuclease subunit S [Chloroflexota bacterium]
MSKGLPDGWDWVKLGDVCAITMGQSPPSSTYRDSPAGLPFFQGKADFGDMYPTARKWCVKPKKIAKSGNILLSVRAPVGPTNLALVECCIGRGLAAIEAKKGISQSYLLQTLKAKESELAAQGTGSTFASISGKRLRDFEIPLPPPEEQHRIAEKMTLVEKARAAAAAQLASVDELTTAMLREIFPRSPSARLPRGWRWVKLGDACQIVNGSTPKSSMPEYWDGDICWVTPADLGQLTAPRIEESARYITSAGYDSCSTKLVPAGTVVMSSRAPIGHLAIAETELCTNQGCKSFVPRSGLDGEYLYHALSFFMDDIRALGTGATFAEVSKGTLEEFECPIPPPGEQHGIVATMSSVERARSAAASQLAAVDELRDTLLQRLFTEQSKESSGTG